MRILVVDDDVVLGRVIGRMLRRQHDVVVENDPCKALQRIDRGDRFDLILSDLNMPTMSGTRFFAELRRRFVADPPMLVLMSGTEDAIDLSCEDAFLIKPFGASDVLDLIAR